MCESGGCILNFREFNAFVERRISAMTVSFRASCLCHIQPCLADVRTFSLSMVLEKLETSRRKSDFPVEDDRPGERLTAVRCRVFVLAASGWCLWQERAAVVRGNYVCY